MSKERKKTSLGGISGLNAATKLTDIQLSSDTIEDEISNDSVEKQVTSTVQIPLEEVNKDTIKKTPDEINDEVSKGNNTSGDRGLEYYLRKSSQMTREKQETIPVNITQRDLLKVLAAIEGTQMNIIVFNIFEDFFERYNVKDLVEQISKVKKKLNKV